MERRNTGIACDVATRRFRATDRRTDDEPSFVDEPSLAREVGEDRVTCCRCRSSVKPIVQPSTDELAQLPALAASSLR